MTHNKPGSANGALKHNPKHAALDICFGEKTLVAPRVFGFIRFGNAVLLCNGQRTESDRLGFISVQPLEDEDAFTAIGRVTREKIGLELTNFGVARFVVDGEAHPYVNQVVTCRASEGSIGETPIGATFVSIDEVLRHQAILRNGTPELLAQVATMGNGFGKFVQEASKQAGVPVLLSA